MSKLTRVKGSASLAAVVDTVQGITEKLYGVGQFLQLADREYALFKVESGRTSNGMDILSVGGGLCAVLQVSEDTTIKAIGATQSGVDIDETAYIQRWIAICKGVIKFGNCGFTYLDFKGGFVRQVELTGDIKALPSSAPILMDFSSSTQQTEIVQVNLGGFTVDCNFQNQLARNSLIKIDYTHNLEVFEGKIKNIYAYGIGGTWSAYKYARIHKVDFEEGSLHNGSLDASLAEACHFVGMYGGDKTDITFCTFRQLTAPVGTQNRNPGGVFISGSNPNKVVNVSDCEFDNLGNLIGGNLVSPLDIYSHSRFVTYARNRFTNSRYIPFRANAAQALIYDNFVLQTNPITYDGGAVYNDAALLAVGIVPRGYDVNKRDNYSYMIRGNVFTITQAAGNCRAVIVASDSTENVVLGVTLKDNTYISHTGNSLEAVLLDNIMNATIDDSVIEGFTIGYRIQRTDVASAIAVAKGHSGKSRFSISAKSMKGTGTGVFARLNVTNLNITLKETDFSETTLPYTIRNAKVVRVNDCTMGDTSAGDTNTNAAFYFTGNDSSVCGTDPVGYSTNSYYRLLNNIGRTDRLS